jgi:hypothetical protein
MSLSKIKKNESSKEYNKNIKDQILMLERILVNLGILQVSEDYKKNKSKSLTGFSRHQIIEFANSYLMNFISHNENMNSLSNNNNDSSGGAAPPPPPLYTEEVQRKRSLSVEEQNQNNKIFKENANYDVSKFKENDSIQHTDENEKFEEKIISEKECLGIGSPLNFDFKLDEDFNFAVTNNFDNELEYFDSLFGYNNNNFDNDFQKDYKGGF